jgi:hypothetical protein
MAAGVCCGAAGAADGVAEDDAADFAAEGAVTEPAMDVLTVKTSLICIIPSYDSRVPGPFHEIQVGRCESAIGKFCLVVQFHFQDVENVEREFGKLGGFREKVGRRRIGS